MDDRRQQGAAADLAQANRIPSGRRDAGLGRRIDSPISISRRDLHDLMQYQQKVGDYLLAYISFVELGADYDRLRRFIERNWERVSSETDPEFWEDLRDIFDSIPDISLPNGLRTEFADSTESLTAKMTSTRDQLDSAIRESNSVDIRYLLNELHRSMADMKRIVQQSLASQSKERAQRSYEALKGSVNRIFAVMEYMDEASKGAGGSANQGDERVEQPDSLVQNTPARVSAPGVEAPWLHRGGTHGTHA